MTDAPKSPGTDPSRLVKARANGDGKFVAEWTLTPDTITEEVVIQINTKVLPIVFVPGIMGSNLRVKTANGAGAQVWRLDATAGQPLTLFNLWRNASAGNRQTLLHPDRCEVDGRGGTPEQLLGTVTDLARYRQRGWGEVGQTSYQEFLAFLERKLNNGNTHKLNNWLSAHGEPNAMKRWSSEKPIAGLTEEEVKATNGWMFPVYACGYNWLASNEVAAKQLAKRITEVVNENNNGKLRRCEQVLLITHSMGGLVARRCQMLFGMQNKIAGVIHGVMPAVGAPIAYRRTRAGMDDEDAVVAKVIGHRGTDITPVFAQAPGALQLLPNAQYPKGWLKICDENGKVMDSFPKADPYAEIYANKTNWWGLVQEAWLAPENGPGWSWDRYIKFGLKPAQEFHETLGTAYHPNSYVFYGGPDSAKSLNSAATLSWKKYVFKHQSQPAITPPIATMPNEAFSTHGGPASLYSETQQMPWGGSQQVVPWKMELSLFDAGGDGTVPCVSGCAPLTQSEASITQQVRLPDFGHEGAFKDSAVQDYVLYALAKILAKAKTPQARA